MRLVGDHMTFLISMGIFLSIVLFIHGACAVHSMFFNPEVQRIKRRLKDSSHRRLEVEHLRLVRVPVLSHISWINALLVRINWIHPLRRLVEQAGVRTPPGVFLPLSGLFTVVAFYAAGVRGLPSSVALSMALLAGSFPFLYLYWKRRQQFLQFERQFPQALDMIARAMQAGHAFVVGLQMVSNEFPDPIGGQFNKAVEEINYGMDMTEALKNMAQRMNSQDLKLFVTSLLVQRETGGNFVEILQAISRVIRQRFELHAKVRALSAQGRLSALILEALPFVTALALYVQNREYLTPLVTDPLGRGMLTVGAILLVLGIILLNKLVAFKV